jgi:hypothetical protein
MTNPRPLSGVRGFARQRPQKRAIAPGGFAERRLHRGVCDHEQDIVTSEPVCAIQHPNGAGAQAVSALRSGAANTLSMRFSSMSTTSKRQPSQSAWSPVPSYTSVIYSVEVLN